MNAYHFPSPPSPPLLLLGPTLIALCTVYGTQREQREFKRRNESSQTSSEKAVYRPEQAPAKRVKERASESLQRGCGRGKSKTFPTHFASSPVLSRRPDQ